MKFIQVRKEEYDSLVAFAEQKLREEFDDSKSWWEQEAIVEQALKLGLVDLHKEIKEDLKVSVTEQRQDDAEFKTNAGWPKF